MRIRIKRIASRISLYRINDWQLLFSIGVLLGAALVFVRLSLAEEANPSKRMAYYTIVDGVVSLVHYEELNAGKEPQLSSSEGKGSNHERQSSEASQASKPQQEAEAERDAALDATGENALQADPIRVYITKENRVETVPLETYVQGVLAGEMPIDFEIEALKAQAIAARTYIVRRLKLGNDKETQAKQADVLDTTQHQVYVPLAKLEQRWEGEAKEQNLAKLKQAADETKGQIMTYEGEPIEAAFFSTSNGYTENSEDYWEQPLPYLRSVASPWDEGLSPRYEESVVVEKDEFYRKLGLSGKSASKKLSIKVMERTAGNRIKTVSINGSRFSGREVRERLGLASSQFSWKIQKDKVTITTYGFGHGVGMSQWGANGMALEGRTAEQILQHYYTGAVVEQASW